MIYIFSTSDKIGARLIRWGTGEKVSHMAIGQGLGLKWFTPVVESRLLQGVSKTDYGAFTKHNRVVYALKEKGMTHAVSERLFDKNLDFIGEDYDWKGVAFLAATVIVCLKILRVELPNTNRWGDKEDYFCSEMLFANESHLRAIGVNMDKYSKQMLTPDRAFEILWESGMFELLVGTV